MGNPKEDIETAIVYPFTMVVMFLFVWRYVICALTNCIVGLTDRLVNQMVLLVANLIALQRNVPYEGEFLLTPRSTELILLFSAAHYLRTAFLSRNKTDISFNLMVLIAIMDVLSSRKGGDTFLYILLIIEAADFIGTFLHPFLKNEACFDMFYALLYVIFKIIVLGHIVYKVLMNTKVTEDIKMNLFVLYLYSLFCLPAVLMNLGESYRDFDWKLSRIRK